MQETSTTPDIGDAGYVLRLDHDEHALVMAALRLLRSILGRDEADELAKVQALLDRMGTQKAA
jgi:hypothetical protein